LSRHIYLDESGTDIHSSVAIVAAVIVDTDAQWKPVEKYIHGLIEEFVPPEIQDGFLFHANDLFHRFTKNIFDKKSILSKPGRNCSDGYSKFQVNSVSRSLTHMSGCARFENGLIRFLKTSG
jgi:hypothetical protein